MKKLSALLLALAMVFALAACGNGSNSSGAAASTPSGSASTPAGDASSDPVDDTVYELKFSSSQTTGTWLADLVDEYAAQVDEATNGRVKITVYHDNSLGAPADLWTMLTEGGLEMLNLGIAQAGEFPVTNVVQTPFLLSSPSTAASVMDALMEAGYLGEFTDNMHVLAWLPTDMQLFATVDKKVETLADFSGLKMRANSGQLIAAIEACGATAVSITTTEVPMALSQKTIDGGISSPAAMDAFKWQDSVKYLYNIPICTGMNYIGVNLDTWNALPADLQAIVEEVSAEWQATYMEKNDAAYYECIDTMVAAGVEFVEPSDELVAAIKDATSSLLDSLVEELNAAGLDGAAIVELAQKTVAEVEG